MYFLFLLGRRERCCFGPLLGWDERPIEAFRSIGAGGLMARRPLRSGSGGCPCTRFLVDWIGS